MFREKVETKATLRKLLPDLKANDLGSPSTSDAALAGNQGFDYLPSLSDLIGPRPSAGSPIPGVMSFTGGEDAALQRVEEWMWRDDNLKEYFDIRNGMLGERYSSKLSPWLALGCISPRYAPDMMYTYMNMYTSCLYEYLIYMNILPIHYLYTRQVHRVRGQAVREGASGQQEHILDDL